MEIFACMAHKRIKVEVCSWSTTMADGGKSVMIVLMATTMMVAPALQEIQDLKWHVINLGLEEKVFSKDYNITWICLSCWTMLNAMALNLE